MEYLREVRLRQQAALQGLLSGRKNQQRQEDGEKSVRSTGAEETLPSQWTETIFDETVSSQWGETALETLMPSCRTGEFLLPKVRRQTSGSGEEWKLRRTETAQTTPLQRGGSRRLADLPVLPTMSRTRRWASAGDAEDVRTEDIQWVDGTVLSGASMESMETGKTVWQSAVTDAEENGVWKRLRQAAEKAEVQAVTAVVPEGRDARTTGEASDETELVPVSEEDWEWKTFQTTTRESVQALDGAAASMEGAASAVQPMMSVPQRSNAEVPQKARLSAALQEERASSPRAAERERERRPSERTRETEASTQERRLDAAKAVPEERVKTEWVWAEEPHLQGSPEELSRAFQRDARRYDGGFSLY